MTKSILKGIVFLVAAARLAVDLLQSKTLVSSDQDQGSRPVELGPETTKYLGDVASDSFKRQIELDESIWRSLPFFAATFAFVATIVGRSATDVPVWNGSIYSLSTNGFLVLAALSLAWGLRWFWTVLRPREYEYPAPDADVRGYAEQMTSYYLTLGHTGANRDTEVAREVRLFMAAQYGSGAATNFRHNADKLKARSKVLLFMLVAFVLAFACEATIFVHDRAYGSLTIERGKEMPGPRSIHPSAPPGPSTPSRPTPPPAQLVTEGADFWGTSGKARIRSK